MSFALRYTFQHTILLADSLTRCTHTLHNLTHTTQHHCRRWLARRRCTALRAAAAAAHAARTAAAITLQALYRGHAARTLTRMQLRISKSVTRQKAEASHTLQRLARGFLGRCAARAAARQRTARRVADARAWQEQWSEDAQSWFYHCAGSGEALWEPPRCGYAKADGRLVLCTGAVIADPTDAGE
jgi:IQ calmodulin-binding motif